MRQLGLKRAVLLIELEPCAVCGGYPKGQPTRDSKVPGVSAQIPEDAQLIVVDGQAATYFRQAPTDPQRPAKVSPPPDETPAGTPQNNAPEEASGTLAGGAGAGTAAKGKGLGVETAGEQEIEIEGGGTAPSLHVSVDQGRWASYHDGAHPARRYSPRNAAYRRFDHLLEGAAVAHG